MLLYINWIEVKKNMKLYILIDEKGLIISSTRERILKEQIEVELADESKTLDYKYVDGELVELTPEEKEEYYEKVEPRDKSEEIKNVLNSMIMSLIPEGETLTKENAPTLVDIINPVTTEESGTKANYIVIVDNDIAHNGYLYTYGKYYKWNNVLYQCKRTGESEGGKIKLFYTPDQLIGHYFVAV